MHGTSPMTPFGQKSTPVRSGVIVLTALSLAAGWIWLVAGTRLHEMIVGCVVVVLATLFLLLVHRSQPRVVQFHWQDMAQGWRIVAYMVTDTWVVIRVLLTTLFNPRAAGSHYQVCHFAAGDPATPSDLGREVLLTIYMTATPNSIVLGIDPGSHRMLFHQIERTDLPQMAKALGAAP